MPPPPAPKQAKAPAGPSKEFLELTARIRMLEERYKELNNKTELIEQNMLTKDKRSTNNIRLIKEDIRKLNDEITSIKDQITTIISEIKLLARKEDIEVLKKYLEYWKPSQFITREQLAKELSSLKKELKQEQKKQVNDTPKEKRKKDYIK